jgi:hypothetical protein
MDTHNGSFTFTNNYDKPCVTYMLILLLHNTNDNPRGDFGIQVIPHFITTRVVLVTVSFYFLVLYSDVLLVTITLCLAVR